MSGAGSGDAIMFVVTETLSPFHLLRLCREFLGVLGGVYMLYTPNVYPHLYLALRFVERVAGRVPAFRDCVRGKFFRTVLVSAYNPYITYAAVKKHVLNQVSGTIYVPVKLAGTAATYAAIKKLEGETKKRVRILGN